MDYFKSLSSAASSVLSSARSGPLPNFTIGQENTEYRSQTIWSLYSAVKRDDSTQCTVLAFDLAMPHNANRSNLLQLAKNAARKLRTTRHPDVLKLLDSVETNTSVYVAVEKAVPLYKALAQTESQRATIQRQDWIVWGLSSIVNAVKFLNNEAASTHGNIRPESIFITGSGEWKLGGFEVLTAHAEAPHGLLYTHGSSIPDAARYAPPEVKQNGWNVLASMDSTLMDSYSLALVAIEAFNGPLPPQSSNAAPPRGHVPPALYSIFQRMLVPNSKNRMSAAKVLEAGEADGGFFKENTLIKVARGLDGFLLSTENEKAAIIKLLQDKPDSFTPDFLMYKVLPALVGALSWTPPPGTIPSASTQASTLLPLVLRLGHPLPKDEWNASVVPPLLKAYASPDRSTRMVLLENLALYTDRMENKIIVDKLWPNLITGFNDSVPLIREATLKAILPLAPKLSDRILNNDLLRVLARTQVDPEAGIRTNTTILLGRLAPHLSVSTRKRVLIPAFARSLKDQFVHARVAGLMALMATGESFDHEDAAKQILPAVAPCLVDKEKLVRDQADKAVKMFLETVNTGRVNMADSALTQEESYASSMHASTMNGAGNGASYATSMTASAGSAASALAGWAMTSALSSLSNSTTSAVPQDKPIAMSADLQSNMDGRNTATPPPTSGLASIRLGSGPGAVPDDPSASSSASPGVKSALDYDWDDDAPLASTASAFAMQESDLMDVHDDSADWSSFEVGQPKKKPAAVGRTKMAKAKLGPARASPVKPAALADPAESRKALTRSSLQVAATPPLASQDEAWGDAWEPEPANGASAREDAAQETTAHAFAPATVEPPAPLAETWASFDDADDDDQDDSRTASPAPAPPSGAPALTKEEKKAELERKRLERRLRLEQLKKEKEDARLKALGA